MIAETPIPPYYAVIFTSSRIDGDNGYSEMADKMVELAKQQDGPPAFVIPLTSFLVILLPVEIKEFIKVFFKVYILKIPYYLQSTYY